MSPHLDNTLIRPFLNETDSPFAYGEHTVLQLRAQPFQVQDELGTVITMPIDTNVRMPLAAAPPPALDTVFAEEDPLARMEQKLDAAMRQIEKLRQQIDSLDLTLARALAR